MSESPTKDGDSWLELRDHDVRGLLNAVLKDDLHALATSIPFMLSFPTPRTDKVSESYRFLVGVLSDIKQEYESAMLSLDAVRRLPEDLPGYGSSALAPGATLSATALGIDNFSRLTMKDLSPTKEDEMLPRSSSRDRYMATTVSFGRRLKPVTKFICDKLENEGPQLKNDDNQPVLTSPTRTLRRAEEKRHRKMIPNNHGPTQLGGKTLRSKLHGLSLTVNPVTWSEYEAGQTLTTWVRVVNTDSLSWSLQVVSPSSPYFSLSGLVFPTEANTVAPGMDCGFSVVFSPDSSCSYLDQVRIVSSSGTSELLQLQAENASPRLSLDPLLDCGVCLQGQTIRCQFNFRNESSSRSRFVILPAAVFESVLHGNMDAYMRTLQQGQTGIGSPQRSMFEFDRALFECGPREKSHLTVTFTAQSVGLYREPLVILSQNCCHQSVFVQAEVDYARIGLEAKNDVSLFQPAPRRYWLDMPRVPPSSKSVVHIYVRNLCKCPVSYSWTRQGFSDPRAFHIDPDSSTIGQNESALTSITFQSSVPGILEDQFGLFINKLGCRPDQDEPTDTLHLRCGVELPEMALHPHSLTFLTYPGHVRSEAVVLTNLSRAAISVVWLRRKTDFSAVIVYPPSAKLPPGESASFDVTVRCRWFSEDCAFIQAVTDIPTEHQLGFTCLLFPVRPCIVVEPSALVFGDLARGSYVAGESTLKNRSAFPVEIQLCSDLNCVHTNWAAQTLAPYSESKFIVSLGAENVGNIEGHVFVHAWSQRYAHVCVRASVWSPSVDLFLTRSTVLVYRNSPRYVSGRLRNVGRVPVRVVRPNLFQHGSVEVRLSVGETVISPDQEVSMELCMKSTTTGHHRLELLTSTDTVNSVEILVSPQKLCFLDSIHERCIEKLVINADIFSCTRAAVVIENLMDCTLTCEMKLLLNYPLTTAPVIAPCAVKALKTTRGGSDRSCKQGLSEISLQIDPKSATVVPHGRTTVDLTAIGVVFGVHKDTLQARCPDGSAFFLPIEVWVRGCPLVFVMSAKSQPVLHFGPSIVGSVPVRRKVIIESRCPVPLNVCFDCVQPDSNKTVDLGLFYRHPLECPADLSMRNTVSLGHDAKALKLRIKPHIGETTGFFSARPVELNVAPFARAETEVCFHPSFQLDYVGSVSCALVGHVSRVVDGNTEVDVDDLGKPMYMVLKASLEEGRL